MPGAVLLDIMIQWLDYVLLVLFALMTAAEQFAAGNLVCLS